MNSTNTPLFIAKRLQQPAWIILSIYFVFMISDLTHDSFMPLILEKFDWKKFVISLITLIIYFSTTIECYIWLNPLEKK
ncbi:Uncharacterised protein [Suttonella ornithocola]|uniref:Uncharacterized protein n=1 Tax=Suttonella ornithocola TaxID=279832 RepID=A0A380MUU6_9GAMM|nr:Uncharacterised protein [Suttonella ornithocola]